jgi:hypothetical protein
VHRFIDHWQVTVADRAMSLFYDRHAYGGGHPTGRENESRRRFGGLMSAP